MVDLIQELKTDHANFSRLMKIMSNEIETLESGGHPDLHRMLDIMDYIQTYPDFVHHPKEDILYRAYLECHQKGLEVIEEMLEEHALLKDRTIQIKACLEGILLDSVFDRMPLCEELKVFVKQQKEHIRVEEKKVFDLIRTGLEPEDLVRLAESFPKRRDPLFGGNVERRYNALLLRLL